MEEKGDLMKDIVQNLKLEDRLEYYFSINDRAKTNEIAKQVFKHNLVCYDYQKINTSENNLSEEESNKIMREVYDEKMQKGDYGGAISFAEEHLSRDLIIKAVKKYCQKNREGEWGKEEGVDLARKFGLLDEEKKSLVAGLTQYIIHGRHNEVERVKKEFNPSPDIFNEALMEALGYIIVVRKQCTYGKKECPVSAEETIAKYNVSNEVIREGAKKAIEIIHVGMWSHPPENCLEETIVKKYKLSRRHRKEAIKNAIFHKLETGFFQPALELKREYNIRLNSGAELQELALKGFWERFNKWKPSVSEVLKEEQEDQRYSSFGLQKEINQLKEIHTTINSQQLPKLDNQDLADKHGLL